MNKILIDLDTLTALIAADKTLELQLKRLVVEQVANIYNEEAVKEQVESAFLNFIDDASKDQGFVKQVKEFMKNHAYDAVKASITMAVHNTIKNYVDLKLEVAVEQFNKQFAASINEYLDSRMQSVIEKVVEVSIANKLKSIVFK